MVKPTEVMSLMYHEATDDPTTSGFQRLGARPYTYTPHAFEEHLDQIARGPLTPGLVTEIDLTAAGRSLLLTFDDGGRSAVSIAQTLSNYGWKGHFFVVTDRIGDPTFLSAAQIGDIHRAGHLIGSHSHTHPDIFRDLSHAKMIDEWRTSCDILSEILGQPCLNASVPGGNVSRQVFHSAAEAGLSHLFTSDPVLRPRRVGGCWILGRISMKAGMPPHFLAALLQGRGWHRALLERRVKAVACRMLGPVYRVYRRRLTRPEVCTPSNDPTSALSRTRRREAGSRGGLL